MIIKVTMVQNPRRRHGCIQCNADIAEHVPHFKLFGCADEGDTPYSTRMCLSCAGRSPEPKIAQALMIFKIATSVATFADAMSEAMGRGLARGKTGWNDDTWIEENFNHRVIAQMEKGDAESMVDLANFAMMRHRQLTGVNR